ncbi:MAG: hypothetical protein ACOCP8_06750 [archaeon]
MKKKSKNKEVEKILQSVANKKESIVGKFDFNLEHLNSHFMRIISGYLKAKYKQNIKYVKDFSEKTTKKLEEIIKSSTKYSKYKNDYVNVVEAKLVNQEKEAINYISSVEIKAKIAAIYERKNICSGFITKVEEIYTLDFYFKFTDRGWRLFDFKNQTFIHYEEKIIKY